MLIDIVAISLTFSATLIGGISKNWVLKKHLTKLAKTGEIALIAALDAIIHSTKL